MLFGKSEKDRREIASLTKIMTCFAVLRLCDRFNIPDDTLLEVSDYASSIIGTSAELLSGDTLTI